MRNDVQYLRGTPSFVNVANVCFGTFIIQHMESRCLSFMQNHELAHLQLLFLAITAFIVYSGVEKGIERFARIVMPGLLIMIVGIAVYSLTLHFKDGNGSIRTGIQGLMIILAVYVVPVMMAVLFLQSAGIFTLVRQCN